MAITLSTGVAVKIAKTYGNSKAVTAASNSAQGGSCVLTLDNSTSAIAVGKYVEVNSGWGLLDKRVVRVSVSSATQITLEGIDTNSTTKYPALAGVGSVREVTAWSGLSQIKGLSASGGDMQYANITAIDDVVSKQIPTIRNAVSMNIDCYDDPGLAWYSDVANASDARAPYGLLMEFPNGSKLVANAYWSLQRVPSVTINEAMTSQISLSYAAEPVRYTS